MERYARQMILPEIGSAGQEKLAAARVAVVGAGGLGCPVLQYLAAAGVGELTIIDGDRVQKSNLHRQILFGTSSLGQNKARAAAARLKDLNGEIQCRAVDGFLLPGMAVETLRGHDLVIDATDNFATRYLINDVCVGLGLPFIIGALDRFQGQMALCNHNGGASYRCLFPDRPTAETAPSCGEQGILGSVAGMVGLAQANEALKYLLGLNCSTDGRLWFIDALTLQSQTIRFKADEKQLALARENFKRLPDVDYSLECGGSLEWTAGMFLQREKETVLVDVRESATTPPPFPCRHIPGSRLRADMLPPESDVLLVCAHGLSSLRLAAMLREQGLERVYSLKGGWTKLSGEAASGRNMREADAANK